MKTILFQIRKERVVGRRGGATRWPVHIVFLICELLAKGTPSKVVRTNIQTMSASLNECEAKDVLYVNFVRKCRVVVQNLNETLSVLRIRKVDFLHHLFTGGTLC